MFIAIYKSSIMKTTFKLFFALTAFAALAVAYPAKANLITNGDFETGDFTAWTVTPRPSGGSNFGVDSNSHSGNYAAYFGALWDGIGFDSISQNLATIPGAAYNLSFWLQDGGGNPPKDFRVFFNGVEVADVLDTTGFPYTLFTINGLLATGSSTTLEFQGYNQAVFHLDDISLTAAPDAGSSGLLFGVAFVVLIGFQHAFGFKRRV